MVYGWNVNADCGLGGYTKCNQGQKYCADPIKSLLNPIQSCVPLLICCCVYNATHVCHLKIQDCMVAQRDYETGLGFSLQTYLLNININRGLRKLPHTPLRPTGYQGRYISWLPSKNSCLQPSKYSVTSTQRDSSLYFFSVRTLPIWRKRGRWIWERLIAVGWRHIF